MTGVSANPTGSSYELRYQHFSICLTRSEGLGLLYLCMWDEPKRICPWEDKALRFSAECCLFPAPRSQGNECFSRLPRPLQMLLSVRCVLKNEYVRYSSLNQYCVIIAVVRMGKVKQPFLEEFCFSLKNQLETIPSPRPFPISLFFPAPLPVRFLSINVQSITLYLCVNVCV